MTRKETQSLSDIKKVVKAETKTAEAKETKQPSDGKVEYKRRPVKKDKKGRIYATGKRKEAIARVFLSPGKGKIMVNDRKLEEYFPRPVLRMMINQPFVLTNRVGQYDITCTIVGGGLSGQAGALRHGISRCLDAIEPDLHDILKKAGFLTRDSRVVERKKYGRVKARKRFQFSKR